MNFRLAFLKRSDDGNIIADGFEICSERLSDRFIPRIGDHLLLPEKDLAIIRQHLPELAIAIRFEVVSVDIDYREEMFTAVTIYVSELAASHRARTKR